MIFRELILLTISKDELTMASPNTLILSTKQLTALRKHDRQQSNLVHIKDVNRNHYEQGCSSLQMTEPAPLEQKWAVKLKKR